MKDDRLYLGHILKVVERILHFAQDGEGRFRTDIRRRRWPPIPWSGTLAVS